jgi:hypothetical protein
LLLKESLGVLASFLVFDHASLASEKVPGHFCLVGWQIVIVLALLEDHISWDDLQSSKWLFFFFETLG